MEYQGSLSNHISQAIISMVILGAKEQEVKSFVDYYVTRLEPSENFANDLDPEIKVSEDMSELIGRRKGYDRLKEYYRKKIGDGELSAGIASCLPRLCQGMIGSAVHGLIYLGYGFAVDSRTTVIEGLAYLHYCSMPLETDADLTDPKLGHGSQSILDVLKDVKASPLHDWMLKKVNQAPWETFNTGFQNKAAVLMTCKANELLKFVYRIKFPEELFLGSVSDCANNIGTWLVDMAITVYTIAEVKNDFFLLHGVTAAWSLHQLLPCLKTKDDITTATTNFLATLIAVYIARACQALNPAVLDSKTDLASWENIIQRTLQPQKDDEHVYKLVQVCYNMNEQSQDPGKERLYKQASESAINNPLVLKPPTRVLDV